MYRKRYINDAYIDALDTLKSVAVGFPIAREHGVCTSRALADQSTQATSNLRLTEIALRWAQHHSVLGPEDGIILGASSAAQLKQNIEDRCVF
jgi:aflatoxin B1 aldehyde reductase